MDKSTEEVTASTRPMCADDASDVGYVFSPYPGLVAYADAETSTESTQDFSFILLNLILLAWVVFTAAVFL